VRKFAVIKKKGRSLSAIMQKMLLPENEREARVLRDAYETHGISSHHVANLGLTNARDVLMHLRPLQDVPTAARILNPLLLEKAVASAASGAAAKPATMPSPKLSEPPDPPTDCHSKETYVMKELQRLPGSMASAQLEVERRWQSKKRRLLKGVSTMRIDERGEVEDECVRNGWTLFMIDGDTRYYEEPTKGESAIAEEKPLKLVVDPCDSLSAMAAAVQSETVEAECTAEAEGLVAEGAPVAENAEAPLAEASSAHNLSLPVQACAQEKAAAEIVVSDTLASVDTPFEK
tara:strand:- start:524 stop:1393 length:870 start_codon:yes stop_codon:yes gene_type:complete